MALDISITKKLNDFSLNVDLHTDSTVTGILGASGSGKSMTLKCIAGIETPDSGYIRLNGRTLFDSAAHIDLPARKRNVGYLFQDYALFPTMTVRENIGISLSGSDRKEKVDRYLRRFRLEGLGDRYPDRLSGGEKQRTALARMMIRSPEVLLLDEPFSALDAWLKDQLLRDFSTLFAEYAKDVLIVSHNRDELYQLSDRLALMDRGYFSAIGDTKAIFDDPRTVNGARLTGCKNISPVRRIDANRYEATDWGVTLSVPAPPDLPVQSVGIRAHFLKVRSRRPTDCPEENTFQARCVEHMETPFEDIFLLAAEGGRPLWWKTSKESGARNALSPGDLLWVTLPPDHLMWLKDNV